jgi:tetratricopeptide (TPR) repeat protein
MEAAEHLGKTRYAEAAQAYGRARGLCQLYRLPLEEAAVLFALAGVSLALGVSEKAVECYRQAAEIGREEKQFHVVAQAYMGIGGVYTMSKEWLVAAKAYEMAADASKRAEVPALRIEALRLVGTCHVMRGARRKRFLFGKTHCGRERRSIPRHGKQRRSAKSSRNWPHFMIGKACEPKRYMSGRSWKKPRNEGGMTDASSEMV